jgi:probable aminopeptidase NPEPL1
MPSHEISPLPPFLELFQVTIAQYPNELSRNMGILRCDKLQEASASAVPSSGHVLLILLVNSAEEAFAAGLSVARNWPLYCKKTGAKNTANRTIYVDFAFTGAPGNVNYVELQTVVDAMRMVSDA